MAQGLTPMPLSVRSAMQHCGRVRDQHGDNRRHYAPEVRLKKKNIKRLMSVGSRQRVEPVPLHAQKYLSEGYTLPITRVMQIHLNYSHILVKTLTALEPATSHFMRTEGSSR